MLTPSHNMLRCLQCRPELMSLIEEIYRAYQALAERYDHAIGALHQAHHTMAEAFPNQVLLEYSDDDEVDDYVSGDADGSDDVHPFFKSDLLKQIEGVYLLCHMVVYQIAGFLPTDLTN